MPLQYFQLRMGLTPSWVRLYIKKWITARWPCPVCGTNLRFDPVRRWIAPVFILLGLVIVSQALSFLQKSYVFLAIFAVLFISIPLVDDVITASNHREEEDKESAEHGI
jgi:hypothetical protein